MSLDDLLKCKVEGCNEKSTNPPMTRCKAHDVCDACGKPRKHFEGWGKEKQIYRHKKPHRQICAYCLSDEAKRLIKEFQSQDWGNVIAVKDSIICPWCGENIDIDTTNLWHYIECEVCAREFYVEYEITYWVKTRKEE